MPRADTLVWLDFPRATCLRRVLMRTLKDYGRSRPDLPDGCPEQFDMNLLRWVWDFPVKERPQVVAGIARFGAHLRAVQLANDRAVAEFLRTPEAPDVIGLSGACVIGCSGPASPRFRASSPRRRPLVPLDRAYWKPGWIDGGRWRRVVDTRADSLGHLVPDPDLAAARACMLGVMRSASDKLRHACVPKWRAWMPGKVRPQVLAFAFGLFRRENRPAHLGCCGDRPAGDIRRRARSAAEFPARERTA